MVRLPVPLCRVGGENNPSRAVEKSDTIYVLKPDNTRYIFISIGSPWPRLKVINKVTEFPGRSHIPQ